MISRASIAILILLAGAVGASPSFAADPSEAAAAKAQQQAKAKQMRLAKAQAEAKAKAKAKAEAEALALKQKEKDEWYAKDRDRGLDIAAEYAPNAISKVRKNNYIAKGDTVSTGNGHTGWRAYMDKYYSR